MCSDPEQTLVVKGKVRIPFKKTLGRTFFLSLYSILYIKKVKGCVETLNQVFRSEVMIRRPIGRSAGP